MSNDDHPTITDVLDEFRAELRENLSDRTYRSYDSPLQLLVHCIDGYGPNYLSGDDSERWEEANASQDAPRFSEVFGPEYIPQLFSEFLSYFMPRKVQPSKTLAKNTEKTVRKLRKWLTDKGYVEQAATDQPRNSADLVDATKLRTLLEEVTVWGRESDYPDYDEGHFYIEDVGDDAITVNRVTGGGTVTIPLPDEVLANCTETMAISGVIVQDGNTWKFLEVWNVYP